MTLEELFEEIEEKDEEVFVDMMRNQNLESSVADDNIQDHVSKLLACDEGYNSTGRYLSSISLVPSHLRDHIPESFTPRVVSIGPVHHEDENLKGSEGWKRTCMLDLLKRSGSLKKMLVTCLRMVKQSISDIRKCYAVKNHYSDYELARMMVMDGCFILEYLFFGTRKVNKLLWMQVRTDLLLVENQIPLFVLRDIFRCTIMEYVPSADLTDLTDHIEPLLEFGHNCLFDRPHKPFDDWAHVTKEDHFLSLLHKSYKPNFYLSSELFSFTCNVVELEKAGVKFKPTQFKPEPDQLEPNKDASRPLAITIEWLSRFAWFSFSRLRDKPTDKPEPDQPEPNKDASRPLAITIEWLSRFAWFSFSRLRDKPTDKPEPDEDASWPLAITIEWSSRFAWFSCLWDKPTVRIPVMMIQDETEMIIRNIIAYEQTSRDVLYFSTYVSLIDKLIDTGHDVAKLVESKIITFNGLGSNEEVAKMINSLGKNVIVDNFYYEQWKELGNYYNSYWPNHIAWWKTTYINNPWNFIALIVAIILFGLTAVQTYFAIYPRN